MKHTLKKRFRRGQQIGQRWPVVRFAQWVEQTLDLFIIADSSFKRVASSFGQNILSRGNQDLLPCDGGNVIFRPMSQ
jgi:hypothetical protein